jgi:RimJ/RimL family protein N-acetyltransferase
MFPDDFHTARLVLRPIAPEDAGSIFNSYAQDAMVTRFVIWRPHRSRSDTEAYVAACIATPPDVSRTYVLTGRRDGDLRGAFALRQAAPHRLDFGYVLARTWWGQGLMTEVLAEVVNWALRQPSVFRIGAVCDVDNIGSARVMEKAGLAREGLLRRWLMHPNVSDEPVTASVMPAFDSRNHRSRKSQRSRARTSRSRQLSRPLNAAAAARRDLTMER